MAKTKKKTEDAGIITDVEIIEERPNALSQTLTIADKLPAIPEVFITEKYGEHSVNLAAQLKNDIEKQIKAIKGFDDTKGYAILADLETKAQKGRTLLEAERNRVSKPLRDFNTKLKSKIDTIGAKYQEAENVAIAEAERRKNHEAELERQRLEKIAERTKTRKLDLVGLGGIVNPLNNVFSFAHNAGTIISPAQLDEFSDEEWTDTISDLKESFEAAQKKAQEEKEAEEKKTAELEAEKQKLKDKTVKLRGKELTMNDWAMGNGTWVKNGVKITHEEIESLSEEEWDERIADGDIADVEFEEPTEAEQVTEPAQENNHGTFVVDIPAANPEPVTTGSEVQAQDYTAPVEADEGEEVSIVLNFSKEEPYKQFFVAGTSYMRVFPAQFEDQSTRDISKEQCVNVGSIDDKLFWIVYKFNK